MQYHNLTWHKNQQRTNTVEKQFRNVEDKPKKLNTKREKGRLENGEGEYSK